ncbi:fungal specific transcription factor [Hirsutella rhossiliensis]|uniref:Fungal specific transcription factor domain-containing protein n=1 Tax=Hirsutella rhossiliensis TaxID=111463 RepID=A0A9P8SMM1_9HYPO|nr:fungal specific transcription factor domain-containing protein [Hirsutella rhossiliensis]KAH0966276.1 fungal specific transcription factor domain-containing protein [Hirsutella rhossiliensis]
MATLLNKPDSAPPPPPLRQIRFVNNQGQPPSKRRRINAACLTCRRRKTRCAGERPICSTCTKNGHQCLGYPEDARKDGADPPEPNKQADEEDGPLIDDSADDQDKNPIPPEPRPPASTARAPASQPPPGPPRPLDSEQDADAAKASPPPSRHRSLPSANTDDTPTSPTLRRNHNHRIPYFRYFGPTAIVPGFKQMVVSVRDRRRSTGGSQSGASPLSTPSGVRGSSCAAGSDVAVEDLPAYDPSSPAPVHPLIIGLVKTFFLHLGCNYPFLKQPKFLRLVMEKRVEPILVDAICALAARFSDAPVLTGGNDKMPKTERGQVFALRAKHATVDTFPCPSVGAVQACLLMAYEGFGANQDSALWMYLGLAIRMAVDLGLQKRVGIQYQGEKDPWYMRHRSRVNGESESPEEKKHDEVDTLTPDEQREVEQERIDTFWAVFILDRVISSGTGRPVTFREDDFELPFPEPSIDPATGWPALFPIFLEIIHLYGRVSDVLNNIHGIQDLTQEKWSKLSKMEQYLTRLYKNWDARLQFNVSNFKAYLSVGQGTTFILLHFWFHALFIVLHQPTLLTPFGELRSELQLLSDSRELSMSSAKTICDILAFADLIDPKSFIGNPFTSQPIYIAACAFLMESSANASAGPSREGSPPHSGAPSSRNKDRAKVAAAGSSKPSRHSLLASAANQNYQRCYNSLQQLHTYWGGVKYILTALDQKSKGIWDCETYTSEEYESTKAPPSRAGIGGEHNHASPKMGGPPPIAWSLAGTANSPNSNLTLMYQNWNANMMPPAQQQPPMAGVAAQASTPPGNMVYDPIRQSLPAEAGAMYPPAIPQANTSAARHSPRFAKPRRLSAIAGRPASGQLTSSYDGMSDEGEGPKLFAPPGYTPSSQHSSGGLEPYNASPVGKMADAHAASRGVANTNTGGPSGVPQNVYYVQGAPYPAPWGVGMGNMDAITFDSQDIDIGALGLQQQELMSGWLDYIPNDVLNMLENHEMGHAAQGGSRPH